jgi:general secretion pathway protein N
MPGLRRPLLAGVATLVVGIVVLFPARVAWHWAAPDGVAASGIEGSIWHGSAFEASANGLYLRDIEWQWLPTKLFAGQIAYRIAAVPGSGFVNADIGVTPGGRVHIQALRGSVPLPALESLVGVPGLAGTANVDIATLELADGLPLAADGTVEVSGLVVPLIARAPLGSYHAEVQTRDGGILATVQDDGAVVDLAGRLQLGSERAYDFLGYVAPTENTPPELLRQMEFLGSQNERGQYELRLSGVF